ncbi:MAG: hypothetical protein ACRDRT_00505 [Pseudonocardiaceae bacterium]
MDQYELDALLIDSLLTEAAEGLDSIADRLIALHDGWRADGADSDALAWLGQIIGDLGWWNGRLAGGVRGVDVSTLQDVATLPGTP